MKYKKYILTFTGDPETVAFLRRKVRKEHGSLGEARALGRAAKTLFGVEYKVASVAVPRLEAERVKSL